MTQSIILEFEGVGKDDYDKINKILGIDLVTGAGDWPPPLLNHTGAVKANGAWWSTRFGSRGRARRNSWLDSGRRCRKPAWRRRFVWSGSTLSGTTTPTRTDSSGIFGRLKEFGALSAGSVPRIPSLDAMLKPCRSAC
jgi:hypothetical protein